jgi:uncharacterized protein
MILDLSRMHGAHERLDRTYEASAFGGPDEAYAVVKPVRLTFDIYKDNQQYHLIGHVATTLELSCGRCLEPFPLAVDEAFDLLYLPQSENTGEGEVPIEEDDLNTAFYRDEQIDLGQLVREQFYLVLPMKPLCGEGCRGLCPYCGTNLNTGSCACRVSREDPRLAGLRSLFHEPPAGRTDGGADH